MDTNLDTPYPWISHITWIGFDFDGTLYRITKIMNQRQNQAVVRILAEMRQAPIKQVRKRYYALFDKYKSKTLALRSLGIDNPQFLLSQIADEVNITSYLRPHLQEVSLIKRLKKRYRLFILTSSTRKKMEEISYKIGYDLEKDFVFTITADEADKNSGEGFTRCLEKTDAVAKHIVYIGDNETRDIIPAKERGMKTIMVFRSSLLADIAVPRLSSLKEIFFKKSGKKI